LIASIAVISTAEAACAACASSMEGVWHFHAIEAGQDVGGGAIQRCVATVASDGTFSAPCTIYEVGNGTAKKKTVRGTLSVSASCDLTGTIRIGGGDAPVKIQFGHVNGNAGGGVATQNTGTSLQVLHFDLIKH
jgi:hypothetical protein